MSKLNTLAKMIRNAQRNEVAEAFVDDLLYSIEQDNKNETEQVKFNKEIREFYEPIVLVENEDLKISAISVQYLNDYGE